MPDRKPPANTTGTGHDLPLHGYAARKEGERKEGAARLRELERKVGKRLEALSGTLGSTGLDEAAVRKMAAAVGSAPPGVREQLAEEMEARYAPEVRKALAANQVDEGALLAELLQALEIPEEEFVPGSFLTGGRAMRVGSGSGHTGANAPEQASGGKR